MPYFDLLQTFEEESSSFGFSTDESLISASSVGLPTNVVTHKNSDKKGPVDSSLHPLFQSLSQPTINWYITRRMFGYAHDAWRTVPKSPRLHHRYRLSVYTALFC